jgi:hypothetical protein
MLAPLLSLWLQTTPPGPTCAEVDARILKRRHFLAIRQQERIQLGPNVTSPFCLSHQEDEDCQQLSPFQDQRDISRDVSEYEQKADAGPPDTDPVIVPLIRKRTELKCPGPVPQLPAPPPTGQ